MKFKKTSIILLASLAIFMFSGIASAYTFWNVGYGVGLDVYGYGADWSGSCFATQVTDGGDWRYYDVTGVKDRCQVYENGVKIVDTSRTDTSSPYSAELTGSESSDNESNTWKVRSTGYCRAEGNTSYEYVGYAEMWDTN
ncbi:MAG TPA: hypothetical protein VN426_11865 [Syntrophomonadaceae bacterium]|nr:hypothetical protein [Syntrophomonadaceae bacterium]